MFGLEEKIYKNRKEIGINVLISNTVILSRKELWISDRGEGEVCVKEGI